MTELSTRDKLAVFLAARFAITNPVAVAHVLAPFVDELLAAAREDGYREAMGFAASVGAVTVRPADGGEQ